MTNKISASSMLADMQKMAAEASRKTQMMPLDAADIGGVEQTQRLDFGQLLKGALSNVNSLQQESNKLKTAFEMGEPGIDLPQVMVASQKAGVAFTATVEVRNKLIDAYKTIMSMSV
ncbi:MAG: flagellar hook-basal body complex protein FliE [Gammaproteobacteria bacterium]|nr:flagellar hook-basal body complex protein FliE [Gammaproteobacteria bacterium]